MTKRPFQPKRKRRQKKHGFIARMSSKSGTKVIKNRRRKGRRRVAV